MLMMDMELEPRVKPLTYKVKGMSRESPSQKALHVLDSDLRTHWSTATNTKEWLLLELEEPCLLSHIRIYNKSVLEWEIAVSLRYKPEAFVKVRPRCEAPRRDMIYPMNYTPCRYVRISCLRGSPIAIFFVQLIGVSVVGLEAEFQPLVNYLLPQIISHKQDAHDIYLQLLQDVTTKLLPFLPQLEADLENFSEAPESSIRFFAMLVGPLYPILWIVYEKEVARASGSASESDVLKHNQSTALLVSSNFEAQPRRSRSPSPYTQSVSSSVAFRRDTVFMLLRKAYKDSHLGSVCRVVCRAMQKLNGPTNSGEASIFSGGTCMVSEDSGKAESSSSQTDKADYSSLFGDEFKIPPDNWDSCLLHVLDMGAVEEGMLHVLYACASEPFLCSKLAESSLEFWSALPLVQAMVPALRPACSHFDQFDDIFLQWKQPFVQRSLSQIVASLSSSLYRSLLDACAGYLSSFSQSHVKAACNLIDLCFGPLAPWISTVIAKIDLAIELLEDLVSAIQDVRHSASRARAALKYVLLALSGHMDDVLSKYKEAKHRLLFLIEMLEPFLDPAITISKNAIAFGDVSAIYMEKQERSCAASLNIIRTAVHRQTVLPSLELEWKHGNVAPSVLLSILGPHMDLPSDVDLCKYPDSKSTGSESFASSSGSLAFCHGTSAKSNGNDLSNGKIDTLEATADVDINEDAGLFFVPLELKNTILRNLGNISDGNCLEKNSSDSIPSDLTRGMKHLSEKILNNQFKTGLILDIGMPVEFFNLQADYLQLVNRQVCELKASEFQRLAHELHSQQELTPEGHDAAIDSLLLAAECYVNPFFFMSFGNSAKLSNVLNDSMDKIISRNYYRREENTAVKQFKVRNNNNMTIIADLERRRDKIVLQIILQAASLDKEYHMNMSNGKNCYYETEEVINGIEVSPLDEPSMDAVTLVRHNQALLCHFIMRHLQRDQHSMHEVLMQCLLFLLHSATELICSSDDIVDVILRSAEQLNKLLTSLYYHIKEDNQQLNPEKVHQVQRRWVLLQRLVVASCGGDDRSSTIFTLDGVQYRNLVPPLSWLERISTFSSSALPLVRFLGWMAVSSYAKKLIKEHLYLVTEFSQLTCLLSIFTDELAIVDEFVLNKVDGFGLMHSEIKEDLLAGNGCGSHERASSERSFHLIYPDLQKFFPNMKRQFEAFGEVILEAVGLHLKYLPLRDIPDALCWLSDLCLWPFHGVADNIILTGISNSQPKGISAKNARAVILYVLETIVAEHMEAMVPETPRVVHILTALCRNSFCDVAFLDSVLQLLKPLISYALRKVYEDENLLSDESSCQNFESLCFKELFSNIAINPQGGISEEHYHGALVIFIIGSFFPDLSFLKRTEAFQSLMTWADFVSFEKTSSFHDYLFAFQKLMENCLEVLIQTFKNFGFCLASQKSQMLGVEATESPDDKVSSILDDLFSSLLSEVKKEFENTDNETHSSNERIRGLHVEEIKEFSTGLENLTLKLFPSLNRCWKLHPRLAKKLVITSSRCYLYCKCLCSIHQLITVEGNKDSPTAIFSTLNDNISDHWKAALRNFLEVIMGFEQNHFWQIASIMLDYLLLLPLTIPVEQVVPTICSAMKNFCCHAPKISWRLQTDKWLFILFVRDIGSLEEDCSSLVELFSTMLSHAEPEQRSIAIQHLARVVRQGTNEKVKLSFALQNKSLTLDTAISFSESFLSDLVASTWDMVASVSSSDPSLVLRIRAAVLLLDCIPFAQQSQLQCFLCSYNKIFHGMEKVNHPMREGLLTRLSLALLGTACLYSSSEDIALIPQSVWENVEMLGKTKTEGSMGYLEKACQALCDLRNQGDAAKEALKEALSSTAAIEDRDPEFEKTRESILRVVANLTSAQSYIDFFAKKEDQEAMEIEEAEIELELIHSEKRPQDLSRGLKDEALQYLNYPLSSFKEKENNRLELIKDSIHSLEKAKIREEVALRRQKKLHEMHIRRKYLEEAALQEAELLMEHDRERTSEIEREIERQRVLELERAKTRELRHNLEMERERQMQRELQRELEQAELGIRSSQRREFSSTTSGRPRERYREREVGRAGPDGSLRSSSRDREGDTTVQAGVSLPTNLSTAMPTILTGSRSFTGQVSTILQSRERSEEHFGGFEDNFEGGRDLGDIGSMEEPELASAFEASPGGYALIHNKQGSRGSKSRQIIERRDRDGRREGKWERKHS